MYRPCLHCGGKYDKKYCATICTYGEDKLEIKEREVAEEAREQRQAECEHCHDGKAIAINYINDSVIISRTKGGAYFLGTDKFDFEINNCPMCGRELRKAAE